jgi:hypothetical protein
MEGITMFFITSAPRSGSTSLATICNDSNNCKCLIEPHYDCRILSRDLMDGKVGRKEAIAWIKKNIKPGPEIYAEKDYVYAPLIPYLYEVFECDFVFIKRDGRDVVRSLINKHTQTNGSCYRECKEKMKLTKRAKKLSKRNLRTGDVADYCRPRPNSNDPLYSEWLDLSRMEMCAFYWTKINEIHLKELNLIPKNKWVTVDYSSKNLTDQIVDMVHFLGLKGLKKKKIKKRLDEKINSMKWRNIKDGDFPHWTKWGRENIKKFDRIAGSMMKELGYA